VYSDIKSENVFITKTPDGEVAKCVIGGTFHRRLGNVREYRCVFVG